jgi:hypothetical protein
MSFALVHKNKNKQTDNKTSTSAKPSHHHKAMTPHESIIHLQRTIGNQAVLRLMRTHNLGIDFATIPIQPKLKVSQPNDRYEQEADRVAEQVMNMPISDSVAPMSTAKELNIDRKCSACEMMKEEKDQELNINRKPSSSPGFEASDEVMNEINNIRSGSGSPLDPNTKDFMQSRFHHDFSEVKIHSGEKAGRTSNSVNAFAYTVGNDIIFGEGQYRPDTFEGKRLLAHELTHVVQQTGSMTSGDKEQSNFIEQHLSSPHLQGAWRLDRVEPEGGFEVSYTRDNGSVSPLLTPGKMASGTASAWQEQGLVHQKVGGEAQLADWVTNHYIFRNDGQDRDFLQLRIPAQLAGSAKAEDLRYARAGAVVWGRVIERTAANPTPPIKQLFQIKGGGISAATVGDLGVIEAEIPIGEGGSARITIPLKKVDEGAFAPFSESDHLVHDIPSTVDEVDVLLGSRIEADADIETAFFGLSPLISQNKNTSRAYGMFILNWESRPAPGAAGPKDVKISRMIRAQAICKCVGDKACGAGIYKKYFYVEHCRDAKLEAEKLCNNDPEMIEKCTRPKCYYRHGDYKCPA